jgi:hypothetical protein
MAATILIAVGGWACVRTGGVTNDLKPDLQNEFFPEHPLNIGRDVILVD